MSALAQFLAEIGDDDDSRGEGLPEAQIERLKEVAARIAAGNKFKVGDIVTVRKDAPVKGAGKPHLIIEIDKDAPRYQGTVGNWPFAVRHDVILISVVGDSIAPHAVPFWALEAFSAEA
ncbi:MAG: hypothetical protein ACTHKQ_25890 [Mesorhizobium sp.]